MRALGYLGLLAVVVILAILAVNVLKGVASASGLGEDKALKQLNSGPKGADDETLDPKGEMSDVMHDALHH